MIADAQAALALNAGNRVVGVYWSQGEADRGKVSGASYPATFAALVSATRAALNAPALPFVISGLNPDAQDNPTTTAAMIAHQASLAASEANGITGVVYSGWRSAWGHGTKAAPENTADTVRFGTDANRLRGVQAAIDAAEVIAPVDLMAKWMGYATTNPAWESVAPRPNVTIDAAKIPPGAAQAHVRLSLDGPIIGTCYVRIAVTNVRGFNVGNGSEWVPDQYVVWRPGDDLDHWVTITIPEKQRNQAVGASFTVRLQKGKGGFANDRGVLGTVTVVEGAVNQLPAEMPVHRSPLRIDFSAPAASADLAAMEWSDTGFAADGTTPVWRSRLSHGYAQTGNGEDGLYSNTDVIAEADNPHSKGTDSAGRAYVRLHTKKFNAPVADPNGTVSYNYQASVLTGQFIDEFCGRTGVWRAKLVTPDRLGAWSAFWAIGRTSATGASTWPPEIDFLEHFNGAYGTGRNGTDWSMAGRMTSMAQHAGVRGSNTRARVDSVAVRDLAMMGFSPDLNLYTEIHDYACLVTDQWVVHFRDEIEVAAHPNMAKVTGEDWDYYPLLNVAVKVDNLSGADLDYNAGSGDMLIYGIERYHEGQGYTLSMQAAATPWANGAITPSPTDIERGIRASGPSISTQPASAITILPGSGFTYDPATLRHPVELAQVSEGIEFTFTVPRDHPGDGARGQDRSHSIPAETGAAGAECRDPAQARGARGGAGGPRRARGALGRRYPWRPVSGAPEHAPPPSPARSDPGSHERLGARAPLPAGGRGAAAQSAAALAVAQ